MREGIDAEEVWVAKARVRVVGDKGLGEEKEFGVECFELELQLVMELGGVEEDDEVVGS